MSVLFFLLTGVLSLILTAGTGVFRASAATLASFEETYRTVGRIEYIGPDYPDETAADADARNAYRQLNTDELSSFEGVISAEKKQYVLGYTEGFKRWRGNLPYKDYGILVLQSPHPIDWQTADTSLEGIPELEPECVVTDTATGGLTVYENGIPSVLPQLIYDKETMKYFHIVYEDGAYIEKEYGSFEDLPEECVILSSEGLKTVIYHGKVKPESTSVPHYTYNPETGQYCRQDFVPSEYSALLKDSLYIRTESGKVQIRFRPGSYTADFEEGHDYLVHGCFVDSGTSNLVFELRPFADDETLPCADITGADISDSAFAVFDECAEKYRMGGNYLNVYASSDISLLEEFHQGYLALNEGRFPDQNEKDACVIDARLAEQLGLSLGDELPVSILESDESSQYLIRGVIKEKTYRITGITTDSDDYEGYVFVTRPPADDIPFFGYQLGMIHFENRTAFAAAEEIQKQLEDHVRLTVYDQGYETNSQPVRSMQTTAAIVTLTAFFSAVSVLVLFCFLYIYRQKETISTLFHLGLSRNDIRRWMLAGEMTIVLSASFAGCLAGTLMQAGIVSLTLQNTAALYASDVRYSEVLAGLRKTIETVMPDPFTGMLLCMGLIIIAAVITGLFFLQQAMNEHKPSGGETRLKLPRMKTSNKGRSVCRYGFIAFRRGGRRSVSAVMITFLLSSLLCGYTMVTGGKEHELDALYDNTEISGSIVSLNGRYSAGLVIDENVAKKFNRSGLIRDFHVAVNRMHWWLADEIPHFADNGFGEESRQAWIAKQPRLIFADSFAAAEDFFYSEPAVTWADGYDESFFLEEHPLLSKSYKADWKTKEKTPVYVYPAVTASLWTESHHLNIGDTFTLYTDGDIPVVIQIAGIYAQTSSRPNIYMPLAGVYDPKELQEEPYEGYYRWNIFTFTSAKFTLNSARGLSEFKDFLETEGYSQINRPARNRTTVILHDAAFLDTLSALTRHIAFAKIISPVLMAFTIVAGFIISWLMINGRRMDFAIMRGLGTGKFRVFMIFFIEQAVCALCGTAVPLLVCFFIKKLSVILLFLAAYLAGTALSILLALNENLMVLLSERE